MSTSELYIVLDDTLVNRIKYAIDKYNNSGSHIEVVVGKFKGTFVNDIGLESYNKLLSFLKNHKDFNYTLKNNITIYNSTEKFDIDLTQYNIRIQPIKYNVAGYVLTGSTHEFGSLDDTYTIRMYHHPDGGGRHLNIIFKPTSNGGILSPSTRPTGERVDLRDSERDLAPIELRDRNNLTRIKRLFQTLKVVFRPITKSNFLISYTERKQVIGSYNILVKKNGRNPGIIFNSPFNLTRSHISEVFNPINEYLLFPKLDGIRYLLYFIDGSCYLLNYTEFLKLSDSEEVDLDNTLIDGELIDNVYYPFDVLYWMGQDVRRQSRLKRLSYLDDLKSNVNMRIIAPEKNIKIGLDKYFYNYTSDKTVGDNLQTGGLQVSIPPLDGVILAPNNCPYNNTKTLKYKPHTHQVIDFEVKCDDKKFKIYIKNYTGMTAFGGSDIFPYPERDLDFADYTSDELDIIKREGIVEFRWDLGRNLFVPVRNRTDKINPNFVEVAKIIWNEINDPIKLQPPQFAPHQLNSPTYVESGLFHSVLYSGSDIYRKMSEEKKIVFVRNLRQNFLTIKLDDWIKWEGAFPLYKKIFVEIFLSIHKTIMVESPKLKNTIYYNIFSNKSADIFVNDIIPKFLGDKIGGCESPPIGDSADKSTIALYLLFGEISKLTIPVAHKKFIVKLSKKNELDQDSIDYMSLIFKKDIYVVDLTSKSLICHTSQLKGYTSIIIGYGKEDCESPDRNVWCPQSLYRSMGCLRNGIIEFEFSSDDEMIKFYN